MVLLVELYGNTFAIPFRTNIRHRYCYKFKNSGRPSESVTGLDFTKAVIIKNRDYIGDATTIDNKEYIELNRKYHFIVGKFKNYIDGYIRYLVEQSDTLDDRKYKYSTLPYFKKDLIEFLKYEKLEDKLREAERRSKDSSRTSDITDKDIE